MARIMGTSIGKTSSIIFLVLVVFISLALSNVPFLVSSHVAGPPLRLEGMEDKKESMNDNEDKKKAKSTTSSS
jgi:hypothetical protein